ncbi:thiamine phosphate synthase [Alkalibacillus aidingensis]|uniref:thiamine phosphate synthase n=1 Tax=Alkalibacillus aidingensis TaxID=2747607 RepID=UPI00166158A8|nr:thiamine phosphate synthase [Alkalibacillus aidingensis]
MVKEIHLISNGKLPLKEFAEIVAEALPYIDFVHLREKHRSDEELEEGISALKSAGVPLTQIIINDRVELAHHWQVKGVQLAYHSMEIKQVREKYPELKIGKSVHTIAEARQAEKDGADYVLFGHIFTSQSKPGQKPQGLDNLRSLVESVELPVIAIGGITPVNVNDVVTCGTHGVAVMSGILDAKEPMEIAKQYRGGVIE